MFPQPPAKALAVPTMLTENMEPTQNWQATKTLSEQPMSRRTATKPPYVDTSDMQKTQGAKMHITAERA